MILPSSSQWWEISVIGDEHLLGQLEQVAVAGATTLSRFLIVAGEKTAISQKILLEFTPECICSLFAEFIAGLVAEI